MSELRLILLVVGALLIGGIWWWNRRNGDDEGDSKPAPPTPPRVAPRVEPPVVARHWEPKTEPETRREDDAASGEGGGEPTVKAPEFDPALNMVLSLLVLPEHGERFLGADVLATLEDCGLVFGKKRIFHRHDANGATLWSMASMLEPGFLEPDALKSDYVHGLVLFAILPGRRPGSETLADMLATARTLAQRLHGELADADRSSLTPQTLQHLREQVLEFERRRAGAGP